MREIYLNSCAVFFSVRAHVLQSGKKSEGGYFSLILLRDILRSITQQLTKTL